jgi:hypothetical protein
MTLFDFLPCRFRVSVHERYEFMTQTQRHLKAGKSVVCFSKVVLSLTENYLLLRHGLMFENCK